MILAFPRHRPRHPRNPLDLALLFSLKPAVRLAVPEFDLFASAAMQLIFMTALVCRGLASPGAGEGSGVPTRLSLSQRAGGALAVLRWVLLAPLLQEHRWATPGATLFVRWSASMAGPVADGAVENGDLAGLDRVNVVGTVLYASQGLYFTSLFYAVLISWPVTGWRAWSACAEKPPTPASPVAARA